MKNLTLVLFSAMCLFFEASTAIAETNTTTVIDASKFLTTQTGDPIHAGCIRELIAELNGDDIISSVHITRTFLRGCMDSNKYYQDVFQDTEMNTLRFKDEEEQIEFAYKVIRELEDDTYLVKAIDYVDGSMGASTSILILRLDEAPLFQFYEGQWKNKNVTRLTKIGSLYDRELDAFLQAYDAGEISFRRSTK